MHLIEDFVVAPGRLEVRANRAFRRRYLLEDFHVEYSEDLGLHRLPPTVALAPFVLGVAALVWRSGQIWRIDALDADLAGALGDLRRLMQRLYPRQPWRGELRADRLVDNPPATADAPTGVLFTGGVDSVYTSLSLHPVPQTLVTLWGSETPLDFDEKWDRLRAERAQFARPLGHRNLFARSNVRGFVRRTRVEPDIPVWWTHVQHGMALFGLAVPALYRRNQRRLCISASEWIGGYDGPWGSSPELDGSLRCAGVTARHIGFDATRQQKLDYIVDKVRRERLPWPLLSVCNRPYVRARNCGACEKCRRTMTGVLVAGGRLRDFGFELAEPELIATVRRQHEARRLKIDRALGPEWLAIRDGARRALASGRLDGGPPHVRDFAAWLSALDVAGYVAAYERSPGWHERGKRLLSASPWLYQRVRTLVERRSWLGY